MKKIILPALLFVTLLSGVLAQKGHAQIKNDRGTFNLPTSGDLLIETQANFNLSGGPVFHLHDGFTNFLIADSLTAGSFPMIKLRKFSGNNLAHRFMINLTYNSISDDDFKTSVFGVGLTYGLEKIFTPAERLNTYVGGDISIGYARVGLEFKGTDLGNANTFGIGVRGFTGMDYYILPKVYLGFELGYGIAFRSQSIESIVGDGPTVSSLGVAPYVTPNFRLGYVLGWSKRMRGNGEPTYRSRETYEYEDD